MGKLFRPRKPKLATVLLLVPVLLVIALAKLGDRTSTSEGSIRYAGYFDQAYERFLSSTDPASRQSQLDLMALSLKRIKRPRLDGDRVLKFATATDDQQLIVDGLGKAWSKENSAKLTSQTNLAAELVRTLASDDDLQQTNEVAIALLRDFPSRTGDENANRPASAPYLRHLKRHFASLRPEIRVRLLDAYFVASLLVDQRESIDGLSQKLSEVELAMSTMAFEPDAKREADQILEAVSELIQLPSERDLFYGTLEHSPLFFGSITRAAVVGDWASVGSQLAESSRGKSKSSSWYRQNARVMATLLTLVLMDRFERGAPLDHQWLDGLDLCFRLNGSDANLCRFVRSIVYQKPSTNGSKPTLEPERLKKALEVMDGNPASNASQLVAILRGGRDLLSSDDQSSLDEALDVAEVLNATVMPLLVGQGFWELQFVSDSDSHDADERVAMVAMRHWVNRLITNRASGALPPAFAGYAGYAHYLSAWAAIDVNAITDARYHIEMSKKWGSRIEGMALLEARLNGL